MNIIRNFNLGTTRNGIDKEKHQKPLLIHGAIMAWMDGWMCLQTFESFSSDALESFQQVFSHGGQDYAPPN
jgi:hypothetical protein